MLLFSLKSVFYSVWVCRLEIASQMESIRLLHNEEILDFYCNRGPMYIFMVAGSLEELHRHDAKEREHYKEQVEDFKLRCQEKEEAVNKEYTLFMDFKDKIALSSANSRSGKPIPPRVCHNNN